MPGYWLVLSLYIAGLNTVIRYQFWWSVPLLLWLSSLLVIRFRCRIVLTILITIGYVGFFIAQDAKLTALAQRPTGKVESTFRIHADELQFSGTTITGFAVMPNRERVRLTWFCREEATFRQLQTTHVGYVVTGVGDYEGIQPRRNAYNFDPIGYWRSRGIIHQFVVKQATITQVDTPTGAWPFINSRIRTGHSRLVAWFETLPPGLRDYGETLFLGYTRRDFYDDNVGIQKMGLVHLFSISGFQVAGVYVLWRKFGRWIGITRERALLIVQVLLFVLLLFAGGVQSLVRAVLLALTQAWRELGWLRLSAVDAWGVALLGGLLLEPGVLHNLGGQLSYLLTFGLLWLTGKPGWWQCIFLSVLILPVLLWHTYAWHPISILANLVAMPVFTWLVIPVLLVGIGAAWCGLTPIMSCCNALINGIQFGIAQMDRVPGELVFGQPPLLLSGVALVGTVSWLLGRRRRTIGLVLLVIYGVMFLLPRLATGGFVAFADVGQGDATIVRLAPRQVMLVDVGGKMNLPQPPWATPQKRDFQAQQLVQFLRGKGITRVQQLVLTHKDIDHIGNLPHFLQQIPVDNIYVPLGMMQTEAYQELVAPHCKGASVQEVQAGMRLNRWTLVKHPFKSGAGDNEDSVAVLVETGPKRLMLTGDLDQAGERNLLDDPMLGRVPILKFGHHGSKTSTASEFVQRLQPNVGVVSAGVKNRFGHPNQETLVTAYQNNMQVFSTAESGMLQYCWSGKRDRWQAEITSPIQLPGRP